MTNHLIVSRQFGYPIYLGSPADITDRREEATVYSDVDDNLALKARYASTIYGYTFKPELAQ